MHSSSIFENLTKYEVVYLVEHLFAAGMYDELDRLIAREVMRSKFIMFGSHQYFIEDINWALRRAEDLGYAGLPKYMAYSMLISSTMSD